MNAILCGPVKICRTFLSVRILSTDMQQLSYEGQEAVESIDEHVPMVERTSPTNDGHHGLD